MINVEEENLETELTFSFTRKDVYRSNSEMMGTRAQRVGLFKNILRFASRTLTFCIAPLAVVLTPWTHDIVVLKVIFLVAIAFIALVLVLPRRLALYRLAHSPAAFDQEIVRVTPDYVSFVHKKNALAYKWRGVSGIVKSSNYLFITVVAGASYPVPLTVFKNEVELDRFVKLVQKYIDLARPIRTEANPNIEEGSVWPPVPVNRAVDEGELLRSVEALLVSVFPLDDSKTVRYTFKKDPRELKYAHWRFHLHNEILGLATTMAACVGMTSFALWATGGYGPTAAMSTLGVVALCSFAIFVYSIYHNLGVRYKKGSVWTEDWTIATDFSRILMVATNAAANYSFQDLTDVHLYRGGVYFRGSMGFGILPQRIFTDKADMLDFYQRLSTAVKSAKRVD